MIITEREILVRRLGGLRGKQGNRESNGKSVKSVVRRAIKLVIVALVLSVIFITVVMFRFGIVPEGWNSIIGKYSIETINEINGCEEMYADEMDIDGIHVTVYASKHIDDVPNEYVKYMVCTSKRAAKKLMKHYEEMLCDDHVSGEDYVEGHMADTLDSDDTVSVDDLYVLYTSFFENRYCHYWGCQNCFCCVKYYAVKVSDVFITRHGGLL